MDGVLQPANEKFGANNYVKYFLFYASFFHKKDISKHNALGVEKKIDGKVGLMAGGDTDPGGHQAATGRRGRVEISGNKQLIPHTGCLNAVAVSISRHSRPPDDKRIRKAFTCGLDKHRLLIGTIKALDKYHGTPED